MPAGGAFPAPDFTSSVGTQNGPLASAAAWAQIGRLRPAARPGGSTPPCALIQNSASNLAITRKNIALMAGGVCPPPRARLLEKVEAETPERLSLGRRARVAARRHHSGGARRRARGDW